MPNRITGYFFLTRPINSLIAFLSIFIGGFITGTIQPLSKLLLACLSGTLITGGANAINDYFDLEIDRVNKPKRPLPAGLVGPRRAYGFALLLFLSGIAVSLFIHLPGFTIALLSSVALYAYSRRLKRTVLWGNLTVAFITGLAFVYGGLAVGRTREALIVGVFSFLYHLAREIIKDAEDVEGDRKDGVVTLPIRYGIPTALAVASGVIGLLILATSWPYLSGLFSIRYFLVVLIGVDGFLVYVLFSMWRNRETKNLGRLAFLMKLNMFVGLVAVYVR
ncbi:MAG TPA: geranylgeranylglycerol-phosphate geranylgeranyltransferase [bacterium]|nr:geranylgeranylglycerol-phosphate geranylgeranyltransferase [bacterium]